MNKISCAVIAFFLISFYSCKHREKNNFDNGSGISTINLNAEKTEDLVILGKVWGYLKYYHPVVLTGKYNWDYELFKILPKIIDCKNKDERNLILVSWIDTLGKIQSGSVEVIDSSQVKMYPDLGWINETSVLGIELSKRLNEIKYAQRENSNYYVSLVSDVGNPQFDHEDSYKKFSYPDAGFRLLALYRYWNIVQYYFPYKYLIEENWNTILPEFIPKFISASNELEYKLDVLSLMTHIHDSHAVLLSNDITIKKFHGTNYPPISVSFVEGKAIIKKNLNNEIGQESGLKIGDVIVSCNGKKIDDFVKKRLPYTPASNYPAQLRNISWYDLLSTNDYSESITYEREGSTYTTSVTCFAPERMPVDEEFKNQDTCFKNVTEGIVRIYPGSINNEYLPKAMPEILKSKGIIIDMRCYPSDFIVFTLSKYLMPETKDFVKFTNGNVKIPGLFSFMHNESVGSKNSQFYKGKIVIIVNEQTQSQAEYTTMAFQSAPHVTVIGNTTGGADGNVSDFYLPGGIKTMFSGIGIYYPDGRETQRVGIIPDIEIKPTIKGIREGRDELLEKAIEIINRER